MSVVKIKFVQRSAVDVELRNGELVIGRFPGEGLRSIAARVNAYCDTVGEDFHIFTSDDKASGPAPEDHHEAQMQVDHLESRLASIDQSERIYEGKLDGKEYLEWRARWVRAREATLSDLIEARFLRDRLRRHDRVLELQREIDRLERINRNLRDQALVRTARTRGTVMAQRSPAQRAQAVDAADTHEPDGDVGPGGDGLP